jgi:hypothetical protein
MKKILEEEITARNSYGTTMEIHVGEFMTTSFWPEVLVTMKEISVSKILIKANEGIGNNRLGVCLVDRMSVQALCQLQDIFVDEKRRCMEDEVSSLHIPESYDGVGRQSYQRSSSRQLSSNSWICRTCSRRKSQTTGDIYIYMLCADNAKFLLKKSRNN